MQRADWLFALNVALTVALVVPAYYLHLSAPQDYSVSLSCAPVTPESTVVPLEGNDEHAWLGVLTHCVMSNLDRSVATIEVISATATTTRDGPIFRFTPDVSTGAFARVPSLAERTLPVTLKPNATWNFTGLYVLPIPDDWADGSPACTRLHSRTQSPLWRASSCLRMLATDQLEEYVAGLRFPGTRDTGYRNFSVEARFDNGEAVSTALTLSLPAAD